MAPILDDVKEVAGDIKDVTEDLKTISDNGTQLMTQGVGGSLGASNCDGDGVPGGTVVSSIQASTTRQLVWAVTIFSILLFYTVIFCKIKWDKDVSFVLAYDVGVWVPVIITYCTKSYLEKKNNVVNPETTSNPTCNK